MRSGASSGSIVGNKVKPSALILCLFFPAGFSGWAQQKYLPPPDAAKELFASRPMPRVSLSPDRRYLLIAEGQRFRRIGDLAARVVALAGVRVNPFNNGPAAPSYFVRMEIKVVATGKKFAVKLPPGARRFSLPVWSPDGRRFAFLQYNRTEVSLWVGEAATRKVKQVPNLKINASLGRSFQWLTESDSLLCLSLPKQREKAPIAPLAPAGPVVQETGPKESAVLTYPDLLQNEHDEKLFDYYLTAQLTLVDVRKMSGTPLGRPSIFGRFDVSPDGRYVLVERVHPPYSYQAPIQFFPRSIEVWDPKAKVEAVHIRPAT